MPRCPHSDPPFRIRWVLPVGTRGVVCSQLRIGSLTKYRISGTSTTGVCARAPRSLLLQVHMWTNNIIISYTSIRNSLSAIRDGGTSRSVLTANRNSNYTNAEKAIESTKRFLITSIIILKTCIKKNTTQHTLIVWFNLLGYRIVSMNVMLE